MSEQPIQPEDKKAGTGADACSTPTDPHAPAGSRSALGAKSDCNGRPTSDDSVVEAMDEMGPALIPPPPERDARR
ncbi:MAG TPA: hypothetical protein VHX13_07140 [Acidobacteriaceae bacterium]|jgi:hypothetical protein|nr:hypothetical protein [Acidobacteriaceae bacterium]